MKNNEFKIDAEAGVITFAQMAHGNMFVSKAKVGGSDQFNIGVGQLIAMKRNEIAIRRVDIQEMRRITTTLNDILSKVPKNDPENGGIIRRLFVDFTRQVYVKINASLNHVRELKKDIRQLERGEYDLPEGIKLGTHMYVVIDGSVKVVPIEQR